MKKNILSLLVGLVVGCPIGLALIMVIIKIHRTYPSIGVGMMCTYLLVVLFGLLFLVGSDVFKDGIPDRTNIIDSEE